MAFEYSLSVHEQGGEETRAATFRSESRLSTTLLSKGILLAIPSAICHAASENPINIYIHYNDLKRNYLKC